MRGCINTQKLPSCEGKGEGWRTEQDRVVALYGRWGRAVYRRALRLMGDPDEARDVTQEAFISLVPQLSRIDNDGAAFGWLYQVATFQAIRRVKRRARGASHLAQLVPSGQAWESQEAHETGVRQVEAARHLALLTRGASPRVLSAALLHFVEGYTLNEVGATLGLSGRTVGRMLDRLSERARKRAARLG